MIKYPHKTTEMCLKELKKKHDKIHLTTQECCETETKEQLIQTKVQRIVVYLL